MEGISFRLYTDLQGIAKIVLGIFCHYIKERKMTNLIALWSNIKYPTIITLLKFSSGVRVNFFKYTGGFYHTIRIYWLFRLSPRQPGVDPWTFQVSRFLNSSPVVDIYLCLHLLITNFLARYICVRSRLIHNYLSYLTSIILETPDSTF